MATRFQTAETFFDRYELCDLIFEHPSGMECWTSRNPQSGRAVGILFLPPELLGGGDEVERRLNSWLRNWKAESESQEISEGVISPDDFVVGSDLAFTFPMGDEQLISLGESTIEIESLGRQLFSLVGSVHQADRAQGYFDSSTLLMNGSGELRVFPRGLLQLLIDELYRLAGDHQFFADHGLWRSQTQERDFSHIETVLSVRAGGADLYQKLIAEKESVTDRPEASRGRPQTNLAADNPLAAFGIPPISAKLRLIAVAAFGGVMILAIGLALLLREPPEVVEADEDLPRRRPQPAEEPEAEGESSAIDPSDLFDARDEPPFETITPTDSPEPEDGAGAIVSTDTAPPPGDQPPVLPPLVTQPDGSGESQTADLPETPGTQPSLAPQPSPQAPQPTDPPPVSPPPADPSPIALKPSLPTRLYKVPETDAQLDRLVLGFADGPVSGKQWAIVNQDAEPSIRNSRIHRATRAEAEAYLSKLTNRDRESGRIGQQDRYDLPTVDAIQGNRLLHQRSASDDRLPFTFVLTRPR
ncbi:MAG: hypothetical protein AAF357_02240 [Verrucomicrobiota bacterium]